MPAYPSLAELAKYAVRTVNTICIAQSGMNTMLYFNDSLKMVKEPSVKVSDQFGQNFSGGQLMKRFNANVCELCCTETKNLQIHHVRKLKDVVKKYRKRGADMPYWVQMMAVIKRKTLVVCHECHVKIHNGEL